MEKRMKLRMLEQLAKRFFTENLPEDKKEILSKEIDKLERDIIKIDSSEETLEKLLALIGWDFDIVEALLKKDAFSPVWQKMDRNGEMVVELFKNSHKPEMRQWLNDAKPEVRRNLLKMLPQLEDEYLW